MSSLDLNPQFKEALRLMTETDECLFITGKAGTGKSTLLTHFCKNTKKRPIVLAPTGVAALNVGGQTIHSFFNFQIDVTLQKVQKKKKPRYAKLYQRLKTIIIDEVSMLRADLLDCVEAFLRKFGPHPGRPFGGVQMIFIGDLYQLPPVVTSKERDIFREHYRTPYFFSAHALQEFPLSIVELETVYRQKDETFVHLLNRVRNNTVDDDDIAVLNKRLEKAGAAANGAIHLTTTNQRADSINHEHLMALKGKLYRSSADVEGDFGHEYYPTATDLAFKVDAQIMLLNNDKDGRWVNGSIGTIKSIVQEEDKDYVTVKLHEEKRTVEITPHKWEVYKFSLVNNEIRAEPVGTFTQYPFRLAWAVTIHKSQGKTFENVVIDIGNGTFAGGQMYVALSRCTSLEGITLKTPIKPQHIRTDPRIYTFMMQHQGGIAALPNSIKIALIEKAISKKSFLDIVYLTGKDAKTSRTVKPIRLGDEEFKGKKFLGMKAFCTLRNEERMFSVDRILEISEREQDLLLRTTQK